MGSPFDQGPQPMRPLSGQAPDGSWPVPEPTSAPETLEPDSPREVADVASGPLVLPDQASTPTPAPELELPDKRSPLEGIYQNVRGLDPARAAKVVDYAKKTGEPEAFVDQHLDTMQKVADGPSSSFFKELDAQYPGTSKFLADPQAMAASHDDLPNLRDHEKLVQSATQAQGMLDAFRAGLQNSVAGLALRGRLPDVQLGPDAGVAQRLASMVGTFIPDVPLFAMGGARGAQLGLAAGGPVGAVLGAGALSFGLPAYLRTALTQTYASGVKTPEDLLHLLLQTYKASAKEGAVGAVTAATGGLVGKLGGGALAKAGAEAIAMPVASSAEEGKLPSARDLIDSAAFVTLLHGTGLTAETLADRFAQAKAQGAKDFYTAMGNTAEASKLRERLPEAHREFVESVTKDSPVENIYIPVEKFEEYFQSRKIDPGEMADQLGEGTNYLDAKATGGDVQIPLAAWVDKIVGTEHYQGLSDDIKFHPEDLTLRQATERREAVAQNLKDIDVELAKEQPPETSQAELDASAERVRQAIAQQLTEAGLTATEVKNNAQLHEAFFRTLGERLGVPPDVLAQRFPLTVKRAGGPAGARTTERETVEGSKVFEQGPNEQGANVGGIIDAIAAFQKRRETIQRNRDVELNLGPGQQAGDLLTDPNEAALGALREEAVTDFMPEKERERLTSLRERNNGGELAGPELSEFQELAAKADRLGAQGLPDGFRMVRRRNFPDDQRFQLLDEDGRVAGFGASAEEALVDYERVKNAPRSSVADDFSIPEQESRLAPAEAKPPFDLAQVKELYDILRTKPDVEDVKAAAKRAQELAKSDRAQDLVTAARIFDELEQQGKLHQKLKGQLEEFAKKVSDLVPIVRATRYGTPEGNVWTVSIEKDGHRIEGVGATKQEARENAFGGGAKFLEKTPDELLNATKQRQMLMVGANNYIRSQVPFFLLQRYDLFPMFEPNSRNTWRVGILSISRTNPADAKYLVYENQDAKKALDGALQRLMIQRDAGHVQGVETLETKPTDETRALWLQNWVYRRPKISLRDVLALEKYEGEEPPLEELNQSAAPAKGQGPGEPQTAFPKPERVEVIQAPAEPSQTKDEAIDYARENFQGESFRNAQTEWNIDVPGKGLRETFKSLSNDAALAAMHRLDELLRVGVYERVSPPLKKKEIEKGDIKAYHYFYAPLKVGDQVHAIRLTIRETKEGQKFYQEAASEAVRPAGPRVGSATEVDARHALGEPHTLTLGDFEALINQERQRDPMFQGEPPGESEPRARIRLGGVDFKIDLFKSADKSSFLHESGHYFLEVLQKVASDPNAPADLKEDWQTVRDWLGVGKDEFGKAVGEFVGEDAASALNREHHEKFARGFEAYLREGKAPSSALQRAFARFKSWLIRIYQEARQLNVELSPEIRGVMDRLLATREEIDRARAQIGMSEDLAKLAEADPDVARRFGDLQVQARESAERALLKDQMKELTERNRDFLANERERLTKEITPQVKDLPVYKAIDAIREVTRKRAEEQAHLFLEDRVPDKVAAAFESQAELHGFASGEELARKIVEADMHGGLDGEVKARVEAEMAQHADLKDTAKIREEALKAVHNEQSTELLALEREVLEGLVHKAGIRAEATRRNRAQAKVDAEAAQKAAQAILAGKSIKQSSDANRYIVAERKAAVSVAKAMARQDYEAAAEFKRQQMLNHALAREAIKNAAEVEKAIGFLEDAGNRGADLKDVPFGFAHQVDELLSRVGLAQPRDFDAQSMAKIADDMVAQDEDPTLIADATGLKEGTNADWVPETLSDFVARVNDNYYAMVLPDSVFSNSKRSYKDFTLGELRDLREAVETIQSTGKKLNRFLSEFDTADIRAAAAKLRQSVESKIGAPYTDKLKLGSKNKKEFGDSVDRLLNLPDAAIPQMVNILTLCHYLDGGAVDGPAKEFIYRPMKHAEDRKLVRYEKMTKEVDDLFAKFYTPKELADYKNSREMVPALGRYMTREEKLAMLLNWGNEGNRDRIRRGFGLEDHEVRSIIDTLDKKDFDFAQSVWDYLETYWPEIKALEMRVKGVEPQQVIPADLITRHGQYRGGYYPIAYDFERSSEAFRHAEQKNALYKQFSAAGAQTDRGHAIQRAGTVKRPVRLSLDVLFNHLENVVHDLEYREPVIDVNRFLHQKDTKAALEGAIGPRGVKTVSDWLKAMASDQGEFLSAADKVFRWFRFKATFATLSYRLFTLPMDATGNVLNGVWELGPTGMLGAIKDFAIDPHGVKEFVEQSSQRMARRAQLRDRDLMDIAKKWRGKQSAFATYAFFFNNLADEAVSYPLWNEVYKKAIDGYGAKKAKDIADEAVARTVGSGSVLDQVGAQRGGEGSKILSMYYSFMSMMFNRWWVEGKFAGLEYRAGNRMAAAAIMAKATLFAWGLQAINETFWRELVRNNQTDDEDERKKRILSRVIQQPFGYLWLGRDMAGFLIDKATGKRGASYRLSPVEQAVEGVLTPFGEGANIAFSDEKQADEKFAEDSARAASYLVGYPQSLNNMAFNFLDWSQGKGEASWRDFLQRRTKR